MLHIHRTLCTVAKGKLKEESFKVHKFISHLPLADLKCPVLVTKLEASLKMRGSTFNLLAAQEELNMLCSLESQMNILVEKKKAVNKSYDSTDDAQLKEKLKYEGQLVREDIRRLREVITSMKDSLHLQTQTMPNVLQACTKMEPKILHKCQGKFTTNPVQVGDFVTGNNAWLDLLLPFHVVKQFKENKFIQTSNPDFVRKFVARPGAVTEADCSTIYEADLSDAEQQLSLVGAGSFASFFPFISRLQVHAQLLPLKLVSIGRSYGIESQSQAVQFLVAVKSEEDAKKVVEEMVDIYKKVFNNLKHTYQLKLVSARDLRPEEASKIQVELDNGVAVADIRYFGDYISKRLLFNYRQSKKYGFPHLIGGTVVDMHKILENFNPDSMNLENLRESLIDK